VGWNRQLVGVLMLTVASASAQIPTAAAAELRLMASQASVIFSGQVTSVTREDAEGFVDIRFRIDNCVRACPKSGFYVLREWAGLWTGDPDRYRVGQRRLMLLTARGPSGMSSPLGGVDGAIPLLATGAAPIANAAGVAPPDTALAPAALAADLRWIQARASRATGSRPTAREAATQPTLADVLSLIQRTSAQPEITVGDARY